MKKNINNNLLYYFSALFFFGIFFLYQKHNVSNDSTISEWLINYSGGFTKRGIIGQVAIYLSNIFNINLRNSILIFQISIMAVYFISLYQFFKDQKINKIIFLSIFTPIFVLYPIAEIEVLARKEIFIFCFYLAYLNIKKINLKFLYKIMLLPLTVLIWEPVIFFFPFWLAIDIVQKKIKKINFELFKELFSFIPSVLIAIYIALNPMTSENHQLMADFLKLNFGESCYMSCDLIKSKASIYDQFAGNFSKYSFVVFFRYFLIILIGFGPLFFLTTYSKIRNNELFFFKNFDNLLWPLLIILSPVLLLFAMGYDWGRWVNISYVFAFLFYFFLYKKNIIKLNNLLFKNKIICLLDNKKLFIIFFIIFCFGWNPKTAISGDVGSKPGYQIPRKTLKIIYYKYVKEKIR